MSYTPDGIPADAPIVIHRGRPRWFEVDGLVWQLEGGNAYGGNEGWNYQATAEDTPWGDVTADMGYTFKEVRRTGRADVREALDHARHEAELAGGTS